MTDDNDYADTTDFCRTCYGSDIGCLQCYRNSLGFTAGDVQRLRNEAEAHSGDWSEWCTSLADRIAALLPPPAPGA